MQKSKFQIIILVVFVFAAVVALIMFSKKKGGSSAEGTGMVVVWGTFRQDLIEPIFTNFNNTSKTFQLRYIQRSPETFESDLSESIASGVGPDIIFLTEDRVVRLENKLYPIPYESLSERAFRDAYIEEGRLFLTPTGVVALPILVDPMVLFYNQNLLQDGGITKAPATWEELKSMVPLFTKKEGTTILKSGVALGSPRNVTHSKDIFSLMLLQLGNPIVARTTMGGYKSTFSGSAPSGVNPAVESLRFQSQFTDPLGAFYTWNRAKDSSLEAFIAEDLAFYFGYASEIPSISARNPNLNFDVARVPQISGTAEQTTIGRLTGVAIVKTSKNFNTAFTAATTVLSGKDFVQKIVNGLIDKNPVAPARLELLGRANYPQNLYGQLLYTSALISKGWLDPSDTGTNPIFENLFDTVISGAKTPEQAVSEAQNAFSRLISG